MSNRIINLVLENGKKHMLDLYEETTIVLPDHINGMAVTGLANHALSHDAILESIHLPKSISVIGANAFEGCFRLSEIRCPGVKSIEDYAFADCLGLVTINLPGSLVKLGKGVFKNSALNTVKLPSKIKVIPESAFENCNRLQTVSLPKGLKSIKSFAFKECKSLRSAFLPSQLKKVYPQAFYGSGLETLVLPNTVKYLDGSVWGSCRSLRTLQLPEGMGHLNQDQKLSNYRAIRIPEHIDDLSKYDFASNPYLKIVELPSKITAVSLNTFRSRELEKLVFGSKVTHFEKIVLSVLFVKDFVVYEDIDVLRKSYDMKGMRLKVYYRDIRNMVASNRHLELSVISIYGNVQRLINQHRDALLKLADESNAMQSKIVLMDVVSRNLETEFDL